MTYIINTLLVEESSEFLGTVSDPMPMVPSPPENVPTTKLLPPSTAAHFTYNRVAWKLNVRKEVNLHCLLS